MIHWINGQKAIKLRNNEKNRIASGMKPHWMGNNYGYSDAFYEIDGKWIIIYPTSFHAALIESGQMTIKAYKENILGI